MSIPTAERLQRNMGKVYGAPSTGVLGGLLGAMGRVVDRGHADGQDAIAQLNVLSSTADWLDQWGALFNVPRRAANEPDTAYAPRIIVETLRQRPQGDALVAIVKDGLGVTIKIADLSPYILCSDNWTTPVGRPPQVSDGQQSAGFPSSFNQAAVSLCGFPYVPGVFGVWIYLSALDPYSLTLAQTLALHPGYLVSDHVEAGSVHVSDGQQVLIANSKISFGVPPWILPVADSDILALLNRHRAAGTLPVIMDHVIA